MKSSHDERQARICFPADHNRRRRRLSEACGCFRCRSVRPQPASLAMEEDDQQSTGAVASHRQQQQPRRSNSANTISNHSLAIANAAAAEACIAPGHDESDELHHHQVVQVVVSDNPQDHDHEHDHHHLHHHHHHHHAHHPHHHHPEDHHLSSPGLPPPLQLHDTDTDLDDVEGIVGGGDNTDSPLLKSAGREPATEWSEAATAVLISAFRFFFNCLLKQFL